MSDISSNFLDVIIVLAAIILAFYFVTRSRAFYYALISFVSGLAIYGYEIYRLTSASACDHLDSTITNTLIRISVCLGQPNNAIIFAQITILGGIIGFVFIIFHVLHQKYGDEIDNDEE